MTDNRNSIEQAKQHVRALAGKNIMFKVNKGRNKYVVYAGKINSVYPSIFTVESYATDEAKTMSYSYNDVLTNVIRFYSPKDTEEGTN